MSAAEWSRIEAGARSSTHPSGLAIAAGDRAPGVLATWVRWEAARAVTLVRSDPAPAPGRATPRGWPGARLVRLGTRLHGIPLEAGRGDGAQATEAAGVR